MARILIVDDEASLRDSLTRTLERDGHETVAAADLRSGRRVLADGGFDLLISDIRLGDGSGLDLIAEARRASPALRIVALTAYGSVELAVEAMRRGADDFLEKPFQPDVLRGRLQRALEAARLASRVARLEQENQLLREELGGEGEMPLVGRSPALLKLRELIERVAPSDASVLIEGETGTGKELVARLLHAGGPRAGRAFIAFNCGAVPDGLAESELFGHERGAFTGADKRRLGRFELADGGTLFLDEVAELALPLQVKLLRALQERRFERVGGMATVRVDVRVVAATHRDLPQWIREGRFREDLYYRLNVVRLEVPPLRARLEDVPPLVELFLTRYGTRPDGSRIGITPEAMALLQAQPWPGNVRQLENALHRACILCRGEALRPEDLDLPDAAPEAGPLSGDLRAVLARVERELIERALREAGGNLTAAGKALGVERNLLRYKLRKHGLR